MLLKRTSESNRTHYLLPVIELAKKTSAVHIYKRDVKQWPCDAPVPKPCFSSVLWKTNNTPSHPFAHTCAAWRNALRMSDSAPHPCQHPWSHSISHIASRGPAPRGPVGPTPLAIRRHFHKCNRGVASNGDVPHGARSVLTCSISRGTANIQE